jgi:hypothetical protein
MKKGLLINIFILLSAIILCLILFLSAVKFIAGSQKTEVSQYYTNLDWDDRDINDIPHRRNMVYENMVRGTNKIYKVKINSQGFRDYEYELDKPPDNLRIAVVSDSVTFGVGVNLEDTYVKQLERLLNNYCSRKVEILNFGASGASTVNELELIQKKFFYISQIF